MLAVCLLLAGAAVFEHFTIRSTFSGVLEELAALTEKTEEERANYEDARAVQRSWEAKKERLQVLLPHNDVMRMDNYLSETVRLVAEARYEEALPKLEVLTHLAETFPAAYRPSLANIF